LNYSKDNSDLKGMIHNITVQYITLRVTIVDTRTGKVAVSNTSC